MNEAFDLLLILDARSLFNAARNVYSVWSHAANNVSNVFLGQTTTNDQWNGLIAVLIFFAIIRFCSKVSGRPSFFEE